MQASIADEIRWRYNLYCNIGACCQQGQFPLARFLALVPNRLRLALGESVAKMRIPVSIPAEFRQRCAELVSIPAQVDAAAGGGSLDAAKRTIRFAQLDGDSDPIPIGAYLQASGDRLLKAVGGLYLKALGEIGHGEGGDETAYLVHLVLVRSFREALESETEAKDRLLHASLVSSLLGLALQGALGSEAVASDALSARLGLQLAATNSPIALGARREDILQHPINAYRTTPQAVRLMEGQLTYLVKGLGLEECVPNIASRLLENPGAKAELARPMIAELVRDCLLVAPLQLQQSPFSQLTKVFRHLTTSSAKLLEMVTDRALRDQLVRQIEQHPQASQQPLPTLRKVLIETERALFGGSQALKSAGDLRKRAELAAAGALVLLLDEKAQSYADELLTRVHFVPAPEQRAAYEEGRCYLIDFDPKPLYQLSKARQEAHLFVDVKDFTSRTVTIKERAMGDFLKRYFYDALFELAAQLRGASAHTLAISNILGDAVAFRGEISAMVSLAIGIRKILDRAERELKEAVSEVLGGNDAILGEIDDAIGEVEAQLQKLESDPAFSTADRPEERADRRKRLIAQLQMLKDSRQERVGKKVGRGLEAGAYISFGAAAEEVDLHHSILGEWSVTIGERLNEAARGTARSSAAKAQADALLAKSRQERKSPTLVSPFQVHLGKRCALELPAAVAETLEGAIFRGDKNAVTQSIRELAQWLHQDASLAIDRQERSLPKSVTRSEELYNAGCVLSGPALQAWERQSQSSLKFQKFELYSAQLPDRFKQKYLLEYDPERFWLARESSTGRMAHLLRYTGKALFKGFEKQGGVDVWELLLVESEFGQELLALLDAQQRPPEEISRAARTDCTRSGEKGTITHAAQGGEKGTITHAAQGGEKGTITHAAQGVEGEP